MSRDSPSTSARSSRRTSSSTWCATAATATTRATTRSYTQPAMYQRSGPALGPQALHRGSWSIAATSRRRSGELAGRLPQQAAEGARRNDGESALRSGHGRRPPETRSACCPRSRPVSSAIDARGDRRDAARRRRTTSSVHPKLKKQLETRQALCSRRRRSIGRSARRSRSDRSATRGLQRAALRSGHTARHVHPASLACSIDYGTEAEYMPLTHLAAGPGAASASYDSLLSEYAAVGFEYGYSIVARRRAGVLGGAVRGLRQRRPDHHRPVHRGRGGQVGAAERTGDAAAARLRGPGPGAFVGARSSDSSRWRRRTTSRSSTARRLRSTSTSFDVRCCAIVRKPLIVHDPQVPAASARSRARRSRCSPRGSFEEVLDDPSSSMVVATRRPSSGSCLRAARSRYDAIDQARRDARLPVAVVRVEQLYPWPEAAIADVLGALRTGIEVVWLQEEPENMGAWPFVQGRLLRLIGDDLRAALGHADPSRGARPPEARRPSISRSRRSWSPAPWVCSQADFPAQSVPGGVFAGKVTTGGPRSGKPTISSSSAIAASGSVTLIVVMPMARAGLRLPPMSSRKTASFGSIASCSQRQLVEARVGLAHA